MTSPSDDRLYGVPGAEQMYTDLAGAYESHIEPWADEHDNRGAQIEEWTSAPLGNALPPADRIVEWAGECAFDDLTEDGWEAIENAGKDPDVLAAFEAALAVWSSKITYRMAERHVRTWEITWDEAGEPLADGKPIYRKAAT